MIFVTTTTDSEATQSLGHKLSAFLRGGDVIELVSDLGGGKTTLTQGIAQGLGYTELVTSPTFTLSQIYYLDSGLEIHHYDLYRLSEAGILDFEIGEDIASPGVITIVEWGDVVADVLPQGRLRISLVMDSETSRRITISGDGERAEAIIKELNA
ncbi:MAG: tRNA (adenosine(37)-N6)-threonylcarbamoyltransferase complex ATPase subunit type 1 TsaE [Candidatus Saccharibacteria bacterium]